MTWVSKMSKKTEGWWSQNTDTRFGRGLCFEHEGADAACERQLLEKRKISVDKCMNRHTDTHTHTAGVEIAQGATADFSREEGRAGEDVN